MTNTVQHQPRPVAPIWASREYLDHSKHPRSLIRMLPFLFGLISVEDVRNYLSHVIYILIFDFFLNFLFFCQNPDSNIFNMLKEGIMVSERQVRFNVNL